MTVARSALDPTSVARWIEQRRWYASKSRGITRLAFSDDAEFADVALLIADADGDRYQLALDARAARDGEIVDALADPELARELLRAIDAERTVDTAHGTVAFHRADPPARLPLDAPARAMGVEQSNSSIVFGAETVLKVFRRLESGVNPELEVVRFLTERRFAHIAQLHGWCEYDGAFAATLAVAQRFAAGAVGGWELALGLIVSDPDILISELGALGAVTAELHNALASGDPDDEAFGPEQPQPGAVAALAAGIEDDIVATLARVDALATRADEVRAALSALATRAGGQTGGRLIRTHGDYHLGQTLHTTPNQWVIIDFEGEPARPIAQRRVKTSPLRDVAGMLRSFAYAAAASELINGAPAPAEFEERARARFLDSYLLTVDRELLPDGDAAVDDLLAVLELEKVVYELRYELDNRPDWLPIPVAGVLRLLEAE